MPSSSEPSRPKDKRFSPAPAPAGGLFNNSATREATFHPGLIKGPPKTLPEGPSWRPTA